MDKIAIFSIPFLISIIGWLVVTLFNKINDNMKDFKADITKLREEVGEAINNTGILSESVLAMEDKCKIRHKEK